MIEGMIKGEIAKCIGQLAQIAVNLVKFLLNQVRINLYSVVIVFRVNVVPGMTHVVPEVLTEVQGVWIVDQGAQREKNPPCTEQFVTTVETAAKFLLDQILINLCFAMSVLVREDLVQAHIQAQKNLLNLVEKVTE
jgi:hypothetical protein